MNEDEMRGCARASETIVALEKTWSGEELLFHLGSALSAACSLAQEATDLHVRDAWYWQAMMFKAAYRRHKEQDHAAAA